VLNSSK